MERRLMNFSNPAALGTDVEEPASDEEALRYQLTWGVIRERRFASEDEAKEVLAPFRESWSCAAPTEREVPTRERLLPC
jgi:hypothetical protein